jgi:hypothetical protein
MKKAVNQSRIGDVKVRAVSHRLFHAIGQIPKSVESALHRNCENWSDSLLGYDHINGLSFEAAEDGAFARAACGRIPFKAAPAAPRNYQQWRTRSDLVRMKPALDHETATNVPMKRADVSGALSSTDA